MSQIRARHISKHYPGTKALDDVSLVFESGKVNALIGKNGSGKSTLVKIIAGAIRATAGELFLDGEPLRPDSPKDAANKGIATVYQELSLIPGMTVAENIFLDSLTDPGLFFKRREMQARAQRMLDEYAIAISPQAYVYELSTWQCQMVEILKAMSRGPRVIMLDEPTSSLAKHETDILFEMIRKLAQKDVIIIYISHRLQELWRIADTCTVLRDGKMIGTARMDELSKESLISMMYGQVEIKNRPRDLEVDEGEVVLELRGLTSGQKFKDISFALYKNEVLGIAGMLGSGRSELVRAIFGEDPYDSGEILLEGKPVRPRSPSNMRNHHVALIPEDRKRQGLVQTLSVRDNLSLAALPYLGRGAFLDGAQALAAAERQVDELSIKVPDIRQSVAALSGGNQQKVVVGKWLNTRPRIMLFDEPSRGIDVSAKQQIFHIIWEQSRRGVSSIIISSELEELLEVCHRILIMQGGALVGEVRPDELSVEALYSICMGESSNRDGGEQQ